MLKRVFQLFSINTVTKKIAVITVAFGTLIFLIISASMPKLVYIALKESILRPVTLMMRDAAAVESFNLVLNSNTVFMLMFESSITELLPQYDAQQEKQHEVAEKIREKLFHSEVFSDVGSMIDPGNPYMPREGVSGFDRSTAVVTAEGDIICKEGMEAYLETLVNSEWYKEYRRDTQNYRKTYSPIFTSAQGIEYICFVCTYSVDGQLYDFVMIQNAGFMLVAFDQLHDAEIIDTIMLGYNNEILYSTMEETAFDIGSSITEDIVPQFHVFISENNDGVDFVTLASSIDEGLKLAAHVPESVLIKPFYKLMLFVELLLGCSLMFFIVITCSVVKLSLKNLELLSKNMERIRDGDYTVRTDIKSFDELETMGSVFNMMVEQIIEHERYEKEMQYTILISEIDPHFVYNTLNTITYLARLKRSDDIISVNKALIAMLKDRLKLKDYKTYDIVQNEVEVINQYMIIQQYLLGDSIKLVWEINDGLNMSQIPKNILLPLVENAIFHGLLAKKDEYGEVIPGEIVVSLCREDDKSIILIKDTGKGMHSEKIMEFFHFCDEKPTVVGEHIGIKNIFMRLNYLYGDKFKIEAKSEIDIGTIIKITIPHGTSNVSNELQ